jgi:glycosyltransferase involved in cell wall biosynthesis
VSAANVCFLGTARYSQPLDATAEKKFRALAALGQVSVIGFSSDARPRRFDQHARFYLLPRLRQRPLRQMLMLVVGPLLALWCVLRHGASVLVAQSPYEGGMLAWVKIAARWLGRRTALVVEAHGDFVESVFLQRRVAWSRLLRCLRRRTARFAFRNADLLRAISRATRAQQERWAPGKPVVQFITWTDIDVFLAAGSDPRAPRPPHILYAGVLTPLKGVHILIDAFARLAQDHPQAQLILAGRPQNEAYVRELRAQIERLGLEGRVWFTGQVPQAELARWMGRARVLVLPSLSEGLGRVVVEAMAAGTPVVGSCVGGIPEIVRDGETGFLVQPGDAAALAEKLHDVLARPVEVREMGDRCRAFAQQSFSTKAYVQGYQAVFEGARALLSG